MIKIFTSFFISFLLSIIFKKMNLGFASFSSLFICAFFSSLLFISNIKNFQDIFFLSKINQNKILNMLFSSKLNKETIIFYFLGVFIFILIKQKNFILSFIFLSLFMLLLNLSLSTKIEYSKIELEYDNIEYTKIIQISDFHDQEYKDIEKELINDILREKADIILLSGDFFDEDSDMKNCEKLLSSIQNDSQIFYCLGNHEYYSDNLYEKVELIKKFNVKILSNDFIELEDKKILIAGFNDPEFYVVNNIPSEKIYSDFEELNKNIDFDGLKILISHRPELINLYTDSAFDLIFSGHAHGGQFRIPLTKIAAYAPNQGFFPAYSNGLYELSKDNKLIVSRGLFIAKHVARVFNRPNIVIVEINKK